MFRSVDPFYLAQKKRPGWLDVLYQNLNVPVPRSGKGVHVRYLLSFPFEHFLLDTLDDVRAALLQSSHTLYLRLRIYSGLLSSLYPWQQGSIAPNVPISVPRVHSPHIFRDRP